MKQGCYLIKLEPTKPVPGVKCYHGTIRVKEMAQKDPGTGTTTAVLRASGDIYTCPEKILDTLRKEYGSISSKVEAVFGDSDWPDPNKGIPVFPRPLYFGYLQTAPIAGANTVSSQQAPVTSSYSARFRFHYFDHKTKTFASPGILSVAVTPAASTPQIAGPPRPEFEGRVVNERNGDVVGKLKLIWVSDSLRAASLEITTIEVAEAPKNNGLTNATKEFADWESVFKKAGWSLKTPPVPATLTNAELKSIKTDPNEPWTDSELQNVMQLLRRGDELDSEWPYRLLCVSTFANPQYERGVTFDVAGIDSNEAPTEVVAIAANWKIPKDSDEAAADWKNVEATGKNAKATFFQEAKGLYFRTAVHEVGHATGLGHRHSDFRFMNTTDVIAHQGMSEASEARKDAVLAEIFFKDNAIDSEELARKEKLKREKKEFPENVQWEFSELDLVRLRHAPDVMVRPGAFNARNIAIFADETSEPDAEFKLRLRPLLASVPYGAPVRVRLSLENVSDQPQDAVPKTLHLKSGLVSGSVIDPSGTTRRFEALMKSLDGEHYLKGALLPGQSQRHSITLLRGHEGPLFAGEGDHKVTVKVAWRRRGKNVSVAGETIVRITPPAEIAQRLAAGDLLDRPQVLFALVACSHLDPQTEAALAACLANPVLAPHFRVIEVKRLIEKALIEEACKVLSKEIVLSISEIGRLRGLLGPPKSNTSTTLAAAVRVALERLSDLEHLLLSVEPFDEAP